MFVRAMQRSNPLISGSVTRIVTAIGSGRTPQVEGDLVVLPLGAAQTEPIA